MPQNWQMLLLRSNACALIFGGIILFGLPPLADCCLFESFTAWPGGARRCKALHGVVGSARLGMAWPGMARRGLVGVCGFSDFKTAFAFLVVIFYFPPSRHGVARHGQAGLRYAAQGMASLCFGNPLFSCFIGSFRLLACWAVRALFAVRQCRFGVGRFSFPLLLQQFLPRFFWFLADT